MRLEKESIEREQFRVLIEQQKQDLLRDFNE